MPQTSNKIIQKGLAFLRKQSGTLVSSGLLMCSGILPRWVNGRSGASAVRRDAAMNRMEDLNAKACDEASISVTEYACPTHKDLAIDR